MSTQPPIRENRELIERELEVVWEDDDLDALDELYAPEVVVGTKRTGSEETLVGLADLKDLLEEWRTGFSDGAMEINEMAAEGDTVLAWWTFRGTHDGPFRGIDATGKAVETDGFSFRRIADGKITEVKDQASMMTLFEQLGRESPV